MDKNYTVEKKNIELTEKGKQELIEWALNYYDQQNEEPEAVDIVDVNISVEQQQMKTTLKKLEKTIEMLDKKLGLTKGIERENYQRDAAFNSSMVTTCLSFFIGIAVGGLFSFLTSNLDCLITAISIVGLQVIFSAIISSMVVERRSNKDVLKAKLNKQFLKKAKKARKADVDLDIEFSEDEYTLLFLEKLYDQLLVQYQSYIEKFLRQESHIKPYIKQFLDKGV